MNGQKPRASAGRRRSVAREVLGCTAWLAWQCVRLPFLILLTILEPVICVLLGSLALLGVLMTIFWGSIGVPHFHLVMMLGISLGLGATLLAYHVLIRLLSC